MENDGNGSNKNVKSRTKLFSLVIIVVIILSSLAAAYLFINESNNPFFVSGVDGTLNYTIEFTVDKKPKLNNEVKIQWKVLLKDSNSIRPADSYELIELYLPDEISLIEGESRIQISPNDPMDFSWTVKPESIGEYFIMFGYCSYANQSLLSDESLDFYEVRMLPDTGFSHLYLGFDVKDNTGSIISGEEKIFQRTYEISNYREIEDNGAMEPTFFYGVGDTIWLNITIESIVDSPYFEIQTYLKTEYGSVMEERILPLDGKFNHIVNLTKGKNTFNLSFEILEAIPYQLNNFDHLFKGEGGLITNDGYEGIILTPVGLSITTDSSTMGTRSGDDTIVHSNIDFNSNPNSCHEENNVISSNLLSF